MMAKDDSVNRRPALSTAQADVIRLARSHPLVLVKGQWRVRGTRSVIRHALVQSLVENGLLRLDGDRATISSAGRARALPSGGRVRESSEPEVAMRI